MSVVLTAAITGAITGAVASGIVSILTELWLSKRRHKAQLQLNLVDHMDDLCANAAAYWRASGIMAPQESKLIHANECLRRKVGHYLRADNAPYSNEIKSTIKQIFEQTTGGLFQSAARQPEESRIQRCHELMTLLQAQLKINC